MDKRSCLWWNYKHGGETNDRNGKLFVEYNNGEGAGHGMDNNYNQTTKRQNQTKL